MTAQEIFDKVVKHLRKQQSKSMLEESGSCAYRGYYGKQCAVGCLIQDDEYLPIMEHRTLNGLMELARFRGFERPQSFQEEASKWKAIYERFEPHRRLLIKLQEVHDNCNVTEWEEKLSEVAETMGLVMWEE